MNAGAGRPLLWRGCREMPVRTTPAAPGPAGTTVRRRAHPDRRAATVVVQTVDGDRPTAVRLVDVAVAAAAVSAVVGLAAFLAQGGRAHGPLDDPNDYAFVLAVTVPLGLYRIRSATGRLGRTLAVLAVAAMSAAILATLLRSALTGLAVAGGLGAG